MTSKPSRRTRSPITHVRSSDSIATPEDHYRREKARRSTESPETSELMAAAKREYDALLAASAIKGKGGRPKKKVAAKSTEVDFDSEHDDTLDGPVAEVDEVEEADAAGAESADKADRPDDEEELIDE